MQHYSLTSSRQTSSCLAPTHTQQGRRRGGMDGCGWWMTSRERGTRVERMCSHLSSRCARNRKYHRFPLTCLFSVRYERSGRMGDKCQVSSKRVLPTTLTDTSEITTSISLRARGCIMSGHLLPALFSCFAACFLRTSFVCAVICFILNGRV